MWRLWNVSSSLNKVTYYLAPVFNVTCDVFKNTYSKIVIKILYHAWRIPRRSLCFWATHFLCFLWDWCARILKIWICAQLTRTSKTSTLFDMHMRRRYLFHTVKERQENWEKELTSTRHPRNDSITRPVLTVLKLRHFVQLPYIFSK